MTTIDAIKETLEILINAQSEGELDAAMAGRGAEPCLWDIVGSEGAEDALRKILAGVPSKEAKGTERVHVYPGKGGRVYLLGDGFYLIEGPVEVGGCNPLEHNAHHMVPQEGTGPLTVRGFAIAYRHPLTQTGRFRKWTVWAA